MPRRNALVQPGQGSLEPSASSQARRGASPLHAKLRHATASLHQELETHLDLLSPNLSRRGYGRVLEILYGYYLPLEAGLASLAAVTAGPALVLRARAPLLARDLLVTGLAQRDIAQLSRCTALPQLCRREQLAGCLYVLEGACLGGQIVTRALGEKLQLTKDAGLAFFSGEGPRTGARWAAFLAWLDDLASDGAQGEHIVQSACETFQTLAGWVKCHAEAQ